jgi:DNA-binding NarL/FixJ family response regulator
MGFRLKSFWLLSRYAGAPFIWSNGFMLKPTWEALLTSRQHEILLLMLKNKTVKEMSESLDLHQASIKKHIRNIQTRAAHLVPITNFEKWL